MLSPPGFPGVAVVGLPDPGLLEPGLPDPALPVLLLPPQPLQSKRQQNKADMGIRVKRHGHFPELIIWALDGMAE